MDLCPDYIPEKESDVMVVIISKEAYPLPLEEKFRQWGITAFADVLSLCWEENALPIFPP